MTRFSIRSHVTTPLSVRVFVNGYGISGTVVAANARWTVVQEASGRCTAVPTSNCERVLVERPAVMGRRLPTPHSNADWR